MHAHSLLQALSAEIDIYFEIDEVIIAASLLTDIIFLRKIIVINVNSCSVGDSNSSGYIKKRFSL